MFSFIELCVGSFIGVGLFFLVLGVLFKTFNAEDKKDNSGTV